MSNNDNRAATRRPTATALGFLAAFVLTVVTIIYTGLLVKAPRPGEEAGSRPAGAAEASSPAGHGTLRSEQALKHPATAGEDTETGDASGTGTVDPQPPEGLNTSD